MSLGTSLHKLSTSLLRTSIRRFFWMGLTSVPSFGGTLLVTLPLVVLLEPHLCALSTRLTLPEHVWLLMSEKQVQRENSQALETV